MSSSPAISNSYDEIPFPAQPLPQSHPDRLAALATLFGMRPQPVAECRLLELACGTGGNLIPMAERHPHSSFVGIDYSGRQVAIARQAAQALALKNIRLEHQSILDVDRSLGKFDYIIAHGVFSWVTRDVQEKILAICRSHLKPQGVAYISYNIFPGWHLRGVTRQLASTAAAPDEPSHVRLAAARKTLALVTETLAGDQAPYAQLLRAEIDEALRQPDSYLFHEYMEQENHPLYFYQFAERAAEHELQYLADANIGTMFAANFGAAIEQNLLRLAPDLISVEQHMDLLRRRGFRQTLLCHAEVLVERHLTPASLEGLYFAGRFRIQGQESDLVSTAPIAFESLSGSTVSSPTPAVKTALHQLTAWWPRAVSLAELTAAVAARLHPAGGTLSGQQHDDLSQNLIQCIASQLVDVYAGADRFVCQVSPTPAATTLARLQAAGGGNVTNRRHEAVALDEVARNVLAHLDGKHGRADLLRILGEALDRGELSILVGGIPAVRDERLAALLDDALSASLQKLAANCLLIE